MNNTAILSASARLKDAIARRDRAGTNRVVAMLLDGHAPLGEQWRSIAHLMQISGELTLAHRAIDALVVASRDRARALHAKVMLLSQSGQPGHAYDLLATLPADVPDRAGHAYVLGNMAMALGWIDAAVDHLQTALDHRPGWGPAWLSLATMVDLGKGPLGDRLLAEGQAAAQQGPADLARYHHAVGKLHADRMDPPASFAAFAHGAGLLRAQPPYGRAVDEANARSAMAGYPPGFFERKRASQSRDTGRPIFVTGLPRSGTTLVEQILASHSEVSGGGELNIVQHLAVAVGGVSGDHLDGYLARGGSLDRLSDLYLHLLAERSGTQGRIVDKTIDASRCIGLIAATLPDAPLIWMRRDPLDSAWSCFRTFFLHGVAWS